MNILKNLKIRTKLLMILLVATIAVVFLGGYNIYNGYNSILEERISKERVLVEAAHDLIDGYYQLYKKGYLDEEDAKKAALETLRATRYDQREYFWINDMEPKMIMHPYTPEKEGQNLSSFKDPKGKHLFMEFVKIVKENKGAGYVPYMWPKPGATEPVKKISYVKLHNGWGWIIGTGVYIMDIQKSAIDQAITMGTIALFVVAVIAMVILFISNSIAEPINMVTGNMRAIAQGSGDLSMRVNIISKDEIGQLAFWFNEFAEGMEITMNQFKTVGVEMTELVTNATETAEMVKGASAAQDNALTVTSDSVKRISMTVNNISGEVGQMVRTTEKTKEAATEISNVSNRISGFTDNLHELAENSAGSLQKLMIVQDRVKENIDNLTSMAETTEKTTLTVNKSVQDIDNEFRNQTRAMQKLKEELVEVTSELIPELFALVRNAQKEADSGYKSFFSLFQILQVSGLATNPAISKDLTLSSGYIKQVKDQLDRTGYPAKQIEDTVNSINQKLAAIITATNNLEHTFVQNTLGLDTTANSVKKLGVMSREVLNSASEQSDSLRNISDSFKSINELVQQLKKATIEQEKDNKFIHENVEEVSSVVSSVLKNTHIQEREVNSITAQVNQSLEWAKRSRKVEEDLISIVEKLEQCAGALNVHNYEEYYEDEYNTEDMEEEEV